MPRLMRGVVSAVVGGLALMQVLGCGMKQSEEKVEASAEVIEEGAEQAGEDVAEPGAENEATVTQAQAAPSDDAERAWKSMKQEAKMAKIDETADEALQALFAEHPKAKELYDKAHGWAVFDNVKLAFGVSGGGGNGVAVERKSGTRTYMKMGTGGVGVGAGVTKYQVIFLFHDRKTFRNFVHKGWQADAGATAAAGTAAAAAKADFVNGLAIYQLTENGLMLNADIAGTKYWKNKKLND